MLVERSKILKVQLPQEFLRIKIAIIGDSKKQILVNTGKTTICQSFIKQEPQLSETIAVDFYHRIIESDYNYNLNLWDFSGDFNKYIDVRNEFYKEVNAILYVYDMNKQSSLTNIEKWYKEANDNSLPKECVLYLVGNKVTYIIQIDGNKNVEGSNFAKNQKMNYFEVNAKTGEGVEDLFKKVIQSIMNQ